MIKRRNVGTKKKVPKIEIKDITCMKCVYAYLMQSRKENPIVAECTKTKERFVAMTPHCKECFF